eukprot:gb/GFBE01015088.1/.p1 GENE.gb/GFBE01015088.1/~~gb/GFBE01015088.1/.p1  ORF type:complete len:648 (+),score=105.36 gb/GFBE01015088.1/:1-1944(+)
MAAETGSILVKNGEESFSCSGYPSQAAGPHRAAMTRSVSFSDMGAAVSSVTDIASFVKQDPLCDQQEASESGNSQQSADSLSETDSDAESEATAPSEPTDNESHAGDRLESSILAGMELHPLHEGQSAEDQVTISGCRTAQQLANAAAADERLGKVGLRVNCSISEDRKHLLISSKDAEAVSPVSAVSTVSVQLRLAEIADAPASLSGSGVRRSVSVIAVVPDLASVLQVERGSDDRTQGAAPGQSRSSTGTSTQGQSRSSTGADCRGWLLVCMRFAVLDILDLLGKFGCFRSNLIRHYQICLEGKTAIGSYGSVKPAYAIHGDRNLVAVKLLKQQVKARAMRQELEMLLAAQGHRNIVKLFAAFVDCDSIPWPRYKAFVFEYYEKDLYERVMKGRRMFQRDAMPYLKDVLEALTFLHGRSIFHRDVKPENLLVARNDHLVLADFGVATLLADSLSLKKPSYTIGYASPEMLLGSASGLQGDAFGAGVVLHFMLSKTTPFLAPTPQLMMERTHSCKLQLEEPCFEHITDECRQLLLGLICKDAEQRLTVERALQFRCLSVSLAPATQPELPPLMPVRVKSIEEGFVRSRSNLDAADCSPGHCDASSLLKLHKDASPLAGNKFAAPTMGALPSLRQLKIKQETAGDEW